MSRPLTPERLAAMTLRRQFPTIRGRGESAVLELYRRLGPVQTQVPRAAFLFVASRLPGVGHDDVVACFERHELVKASTLRGTVHSSTRTQHAWLAAVSRRARDPLLRTRLRLSRRTPADVVSVVEDYASSWRERDAIVTHVRDWLAAHESSRSAAFTGAMPANLLWGHPELLRRPPDRRWHTRTDTLHRVASSLYESVQVEPAEARRALVRQHLGAYGPATRRDVAWWMGERLTDVDAAVDALGDEVVRYDGTDGLTYLDLAEPPGGGLADPGVRLLPEYDGLLLGYQGAGRLRFVDEAGLERLWGRVNGVFSPVVLHHGRLVGTWRTVAGGGRTDLEVTPFERGQATAEDELADAAAATGVALGSPVGDVRLLAANA